MIIVWTYYLNLLEATIIKLFETIGGFEICRMTPPSSWIDSGCSSGCRFWRTSFASAIWLYSSLRLSLVTLLIYSMR